MFSTVKKPGSIPVSIVRGGSDDGQIIYINKNYDPSEVKFDASEMYGMINTNARSYRISPLEREFMHECLMNGKNDTNNPVLYQKIEDVRKQLENKYSKYMRLVEGKFEPVPDIRRDRNIYYLGGCAGAGKSFLGEIIAKNYKRCFPNNDVVLFTGCKDVQYLRNDALANFDGIRIIHFNEDFYHNPLKAEDFKNSLCIFDDIDTLHDIQIDKETERTEEETADEQTLKKTKIKKVKISLSDMARKFRDEILEIGRKMQISAVCMSHQLFNYKKTRLLLIEADYIVIFKGTGDYHVKRLLKEYRGYDKKAIDRICKLPSRWCVISKDMPNWCLSENEIFVI